MDEAKWYVVHTYSGYENKVKVDIEKTVVNRNLEDQILEVLYRLRLLLKLRTAQKSLLRKKCFLAMF